MNGPCARRFAFLVASGASAILGLLVAAPAASAHASLVSTSPADGAVVARAPAQVSATFDEPVGISADSMQVFAPTGDRVDTGGTKRGARPGRITVALLPGLGDGTYTVGWHVISDDSHPVQGAFTFSLGAPSSTAVNRATLGVHASTLVGVAFGLVRWVAFCSFALLIGAVAFVICCWPAGANRPPVLRLTMGAWAGLAFSVLAAVLLQGVYGAGQGLSHVFWPNVLHATEYSRYGRALGVRLLLVVAALFVFTSTLEGLPAASRRRRVTAGAGWAVITLSLAATWAVADHSGTGIQVAAAVPADIIHLSAIAIWLGGLAMLAAIVLRAPRPPGPRSTGEALRRRGRAARAEAAQAVTRFSPIALGCVIAIVTTGTYQAWRGVGTRAALTGTTYGRLLLVKIAAMCALIGLGYLARRRIAEGLRNPGEGMPVPAAVAAAAGRVEVTASVPSRRAKAGAAAPPERVKASATAPGRAKARTASPSRAKPAARPATGPGARPGQNSQNKRRQGASRDDGGTALVPAPGHNGTGTGTGASQHSGGVAVTLARLRWSVTLEALIAVAVLAVTAVLVNTPTARETFAPPATAAVAFDTGGPGGRGSIALTVTPARLGPNRVRLSVTGRAGQPYRPQQLRASLLLPARHLGPLAVPLATDGPGRYVGGPVAVTMIGQWQLRITIRSDAFGETTVAVPVTVH